MVHFRVADNQTEQSLFELAIGLRLPRMLTLMFRPRTHLKYLKI